MISLLDSQVVEQIAAGEVIDRPASVVRELLENALDAGATRVVVEVEGGGKRRIRVADDGRGMSPEEAELSLARHATSKLAELDDLLAVSTMGFRGEGLTSVAAVSRLTLQTRPASAPAGISLEVEAGDVRRRQPVGCEAGTTIDVRELFFNTPARLKFLKTTATETAHVHDVVSRLAAAHFEVHLRLVQEGRRALELPACGDRLARARTLLGGHGPRLQRLQTTEDGLVVEALLAPADLSTARSLTLLVNRRPVHDRGLVHALRRGLGPERGFPAGVVHIDLDPRRLDVNVHPQKREVRFAEPELVCAACERCAAQLAGAQQSASRYRLARGPRAADSGPDPVSYLERRRRAEEATRRFWAAQRRQAAEQPADYGLGRALARAARRERDGGDERPRPEDEGGLRLVAQLSPRLLACARGEDLWLVDVAAARRHLQRRALRPAMDRGLRRRALERAARVGLERQLAAAAGRRGDWLRRLGFVVEQLDDEWLLREVPAALPADDGVPAALRCLEALLRLPAGGRSGAGERAGAELPAEEAALAVLAAELAAAGVEEDDEQQAAELVRRLAADPALEQLGARISARPRRSAVAVVLSAAQLHGGAADGERER